MWDFHSAVHDNTDQGVHEEHQISVKCMILLLAEIVSNSGTKSFVSLGNFEIKITHTPMLFSTIELSSSEWFTP